MDLTQIPTPALVLELGRLKENAAFMSARARELGVDLRPHLKTAKSAPVAEIATREHSGGITVSTLREAAYFFARGFEDITYAVGIAPHKLDEAFGLVKQGANLTLLTDDVSAARAICDAARAHHAPARVLIEIDCGDGRGGLAPESGELLTVADTLRDNGGEVAGVLTHAGHSYACHTVEEIAAVAERERAAAVIAAGRLRDDGHAAGTVSVGSTPTATHALNLEGVTEMRPGVYLFGDLDQAGLRSMPEDRIAVSVLASVIGCYPERETVIVDAGGLALSKDASAQRHNPGVGYGKVLGVRGEAIPGGFIVKANQEHGVMCAPELPFDRLPVGARVRILPNHVCMTAAAHPGYFVVDGGTEVLDRWARVNGWSAWE